MPYISQQATTLPAISACKYADVCIYQMNNECSNSFSGLLTRMRRRQAWLLVTVSSWQLIVYIYNHTTTISVSSLFAIATASAAGPLRWQLRRFFSMVKSIWLASTDWSEVSISRRWRVHDFSVTWEFYRKLISCCMLFNRNAFSTSCSCSVHGHDFWVYNERWYTLERSRKDEKKSIECQGFPVVKTDTWERKFL
jgi:hypothetical protein